MRSGGEAFLVDSPVFPDELEILPAIAAQAEFNVVGVLATHADWDHLLGRYAFPEAPLGAAESTAARLINEPGAAQRKLRDFDDEFYVTRPSPLSLPGAQRLDAPGFIDIGEQTLELQPADGHTVDGMAIWVPWAGVLIAGDYLSPVEIPMISRGRVGVRLPRDARSGSSRSSRPPSTSCRATAARSTRSARSRSCARTGPTWRACRTRRCRSRAARRRSARSTRRTCTQALMSGMPASASSTPAR